MTSKLTFAGLVLSGAVGALAATVAVTPSAQASTYQLDFTSAGGDIGSLTLTLNGTTATSASGTIDGGIVTGLSPYAGADQQLFVLGPVHFTIGGLSFAATNGISYNLTSYPNNSDGITNSARDPNGNGSPAPYALASLSLSQVPLPAPGGLMLFCLGALGFAVRTRSRGRMRAAAL